jgi:hypothetical protein
MEATVSIPISEYDRLRGLANNSNQKETSAVKQEKRYEYGIPGIQNIFNCCYGTAHKIKASGKIDKAITQIGRKIIIDADLAMELAGQKNGGRK